MAGTTSKGLPTRANTDAADFAADLTELATSVNALLDASVATAADLPSSGNWPGRSMFALDKKSWWQHDGSAWVLRMLPWTAYTPTLTNMSVGTGGSAATDFVYRIADGSVTVRYKLILGTASFSMTGIPAFTLPVTASALAFPTALYAGTSSIYDVSTTVVTATDVGTVTSDTTRARVLLRGNGGVIGAIGPSAPFVWAAGDVLTGEFTYRAA